jgi:hypothetical protein
MEDQQPPVPQRSRRHVWRLVWPFQRKARSVTRCTIIEKSRYQVAVGDEDRMVDNLQSSSSTIRRVRLAKEWTKTWTVDTERTTVARATAGVDIPFVELRAEAERTLRSEFSITAGERETFEEEVTLQIAAHTKSKIVFSWKEIRQKGVVRIETEYYEAHIPFEIVVGLTFDLQQIDSPSQPTISDGSPS